MKIIHIIKNIRIKLYIAVTWIYEWEKNAIYAF